MYWPYFSYSTECIGMYRNVLALLFILPRMYWNVSECIGFTFHTPQDDPIHSDTFIFNQEERSIFYVQIYGSCKISKID